MAFVLVEVLLNRVISAGSFVAQRVALIDNDKPEAWQCREHGMNHRVRHHTTRQIVGLEMLLPH